MHRSKLSVVKRLCAYIAAGLTLAFISQTVFAGSDQDLKSVMDNIKENIEPMADLLTIVSYVAGVGFAIAGVVQFKAHKDNPAQVPLSKPIVYLGVGAALLFLPSIIGTAGETVFGSDKTRADQGLGSAQ